MTASIETPVLTETEQGQRETIMGTDVTRAQIDLARKLIESCTFTTSALFALRIALGEMISSDESTATEMALGDMVGILATVEASEV